MFLCCVGVVVLGWRVVCIAIAEIDLKNKENEKNI